MTTARSAIIISASSDIGSAMCARWIENGWKVFGTYRTESRATAELTKMAGNLVYCDLSDNASIRHAVSELSLLCPQWDALVICPGSQEPIGTFIYSNYDEWEKSLKVNFVSQMRVVHDLLPIRHAGAKLEPIVLFFAGGGTNDAPVNYSAYTVSKVALIKICELLDAEVPDTRFVIVGPGWVKTKIHQSTIKAGKRAGVNYQRTLDKLAGNEWTSINEVLDCCDWLVDASRKSVSGRNFSVVFDKWGNEELLKMLAAHPDMYKLRRYGNDWLVKNERK